MKVICSDVGTESQDWISEKNAIIYQKKLNIWVPFKSAQTYFWKTFPSPSDISSYYLLIANYMLNVFLYLIIMKFLQDKFIIFLLRLRKQEGESLKWYLKIT